jgi:hypothetical protein
LAKSKYGGIMKKVLLAMGMALTLSLSGCYGSYTLTKKMYKWAGTLGQPMSTVMNWVGVIVGVPILAIDFLILNTIEHWMGSNPLAMEEGQIETQIVEKDGQQIRIEATKDQFKVTPETGESVTLKFDTENSEWKVSNSKKEVTVAREMALGHLALLNVDGSVHKVVAQ